MRGIYNFCCITPISKLILPNAQGQVRPRGPLNSAKVLLCLARLAGSSTKHHTTRPLELLGGGGGIVILPLEGEDVNQNAPNSAGNTSLSFAVASNNEAVP